MSTLRKRRVAYGLRKQVKRPPELTLLCSGFSWLTKAETSAVTLR